MINNNSSYFVEADLFFFSCIFLNLSTTASLFINDPINKPVIKAPVEREPVTNADFKARLINFIDVLWALFLYRSTKKNYS